MGRFYNIGKDEMDAFLTGQGFRSIAVAGTVELVYAKVVYKAGHRLSLRVLTGINPTGESRAKGTDAIRIQLHFMYDDKPLPVGRPQKCLRVTNWQQNMTKALDTVQSDENYVVCPKCGNPKVIRESEHGEFWGCVTYPKTKCNGRAIYKPTEKIDGAAAVIVPDAGLSPDRKEKLLGTIGAVKPVIFATKTRGNPFRIADDLISPHQKAVEICFLTEGCNVIMGARAGSGKTAMLKHLASFRKPAEKMVYLAFNKKNATEGQKKLPREVSSRTTHSFCNQFIRGLMKLPERSDESKTFNIMEDIYPGLKNKDRRRVRKAAFKMVDLAKNFAVIPGDKDAIRNVMDQYAFELESDQEVDLVINIVNEVLEKSLPQACGLVYDFNDLLWWPVVLDLDVPALSVVLADECQDFNACQIFLLKKLHTKGARIIAVGDPYQAVYRFRGADCDAFDKLKVMLADTPRGVKELTLPINYRCGKAIIAYVRENTIVKDIEAAPNAIEGNVAQMGYDAILDMLTQEMGRNHNG